MELIYSNDLDDFSEWLACSERIEFLSSVILSGLSKLSIYIV
jgi:hypothetical protein